MKVNICGIPHEVEIKDDAFTASEMHMGEIRYKECKIILSTGMNKDLEKETVVFLNKMVISFTKTVQFGEKVLGE